MHNFMGLPTGVRLLLALVSAGGIAWGLIVLFG